MKKARNASHVHSDHSALALECLDRRQLNAYVPLPQTGGGARFFRHFRGNLVPLLAPLGPAARSFVSPVEILAKDRHLDLAGFRREERTRDHLRRREARDGVPYIGKAQERARAVRA